MDSFEFRNTLPPKEAFFILFESTGWNTEYHLDQDRLFEALSESRCMVSVYQNETLVGFGRLISDGILHALIIDVIVLPEYQRKGIGQAIMDRLMEYCRTRDIKDVQLFCAQGKAVFYEKLGFTRRPDDAPGMEIKKH
jgi:ribosomal protein S18 acetylase RimI-like enzyme